MHKLFGRLVELLKDYGHKGEDIVKVHNEFADELNQFVQSRLQTAAWLAKCGYDATALQLITEAACMLSRSFDCSVLEALLEHYPDQQPKYMADRYYDWVTMTPSCHDAVDFHNANFV